MKNDQYMPMLSLDKKMADVLMFRFVLRCFMEASLKNTEAYAYSQFESRPQNLLS
jgi:hypothetical protein